MARRDAAHEADAHRTGVAGRAGRALAQLLKRITASAVGEFAVDQAEADEMMDAVRAVQASLAEAGYAPS